MLMGEPNGWDDDGMCCCVAIVLVWSVCLSLWLVVVTTVAMEQW